MDQLMECCAVVFFRIQEGVLTGKVDAIWGRGIAGFVASVIDIRFKWHT